MLVIIALLILVFGIATLYIGIRLNGLDLVSASSDITADVAAAKKAVFNGEGYWTLRRIILLGVGVVEIISALLLLSIPGRLRYKRKEFIVQQTENGEIRIAVRAVENLVRKCTDMHEEIEVSALRIGNHRDGVSVDIKASLPNNISIPLAIEALQKQIKQYITVSTGIGVREVRVAVENTRPALETASPYEMGKDEPEDEPKKKALHERVFEVEEPAAEPAQMPAEETPAPQTAQPAEAEAEPEAAPEAEPEAKKPEETEPEPEYTTDFRES